MNGNLGLYLNLSYVFLLWFVYYVNSCLYCEEFINTLLMCWYGAFLVELTPEVAFILNGIANAFCAFIINNVLLVFFGHCIICCDWSLMMCSFSFQLKTMCCFLFIYWLCVSFDS